MSTKHLFPDATGLVVKALTGVLASNPALSLDADNKVVFNTAHPASQVSIIAGGGSGHEPAFAGFVGAGMLAASVAGDIFASPSTKQILAAVDAVPSDKGTLLVVLNYTGDCLNFGLASEKANASRQDSCAVVIVGDDVSVPNGGGLVGRRGLAAQLAVIKITGAAAAGGASLDVLLTLGKAVAAQCASLAVTLDHCHVPGRSEHDKLPADEIELGTGPHNETGYKKLSPAPSTPDLIGTVLRHIVDESDPERGYVHFASGDETVLIVNNFGGISPLELSALVDETLQQLEDTHNITPVRVYAGALLTSLNAPAFSISLINLSAAAHAAHLPTPSLLALLDARSQTSWEGVAGAQAQARRPRKAQLVSAPPAPPRRIDPSADLAVPPAQLEAMLRAACAGLLAAEADLTAWDTVMGDGDCGETLARGATAVLAAVEGEAGEAGVAQAGSVVRVLHEVERIVESRMGGTLGAVLGIFFVRLTAEVQHRSLHREPGASDAALWAAALDSALRHLAQYTPAKVGDRTVIDVLAPFAQALQEHGSLEAAVGVAEKAAEATKAMAPKLGRATYVGGMEGKDLPPDPGAWAVMVVVKGLAEGMRGKG